MVRQAIGDIQGESAVDLYAGVGFFSAFLSDNFSKVAAVEGHPSAKEVFLKNCIKEKTTFFPMSVEAWFSSNQAQAWQAPDLLVLDPPREGLSPEARNGVGALEAKRIIYISCNPVTWARDLRFIIEQGNSLEDVVGFDLFPQTHHIECVARLARCRT
jgi:23S rRNA (uracil1939-C5)-methyltransferase